jgi:hypothetical protein
MAEDLLDEQLSMADCSFVEEPSAQPEITTLAEFMSKTGIEFVPEVEITVTASSSHIENEDPLIKVASIDFLEYEIYKFGCDELLQYIADGKEAYADVEKDILQTPPLIFYEFSKSTSQEKQELLVMIHKC